MDKTSKQSLKAGAATEIITPEKPMFLFGYPHVERTSTGVNDNLLSSALYISDGSEQALFIANDIIFVTKDSTAKIRKAVSEKTSIPAGNIMITATHTHSGPITVDYVNSKSDPVVPGVDKDYVEFMERRMISAACRAFDNASPAEIAFAVVDGTGIGTNRHDPKGPAIMDIPVMVVRKPGSDYIACMMVCSMHPTVMHEDSTLYSGDFPAYAKQHLQKEYLKSDCPVLYHTGASGNQSPRHVTKSNTFEEASRIGGIIAKTAGEKISSELVYTSDPKVQVLQEFVDLPRRKFPDVSLATGKEKKAADRLEFLRNSAADKREVRTAECDWFGAEEQLFLAKLAAGKKLDKVYESCLPAEIQVIRIESWNFIGWPGEIFIEYAIELKKKNEKNILITLANGELQGYIATEEAERLGFYEGANSVFHYTSGELMVNETLKLLSKF